jgi:hypothetical protein
MAVEQVLTAGMSSRNDTCLSEPDGVIMSASTTLRIAITAAALSAAAPSVLAAEKEIATIARITGSILVNKGTQYVNGTEGMALSVGERVMSLQESTAVVQFNDGCQYTMQENEAITIPRLSLCVLTKGPSDRLSVLPPVPPAQAPLVAAVVPAAAAAGLAWVPAAAVGLVAIAGTAFDTGGDDAPPLPPISQ